MSEHDYFLPPLLEPETVELEAKIMKFRDLALYHSPPTHLGVVYTLSVIRSREQTRILLLRTVNGKTEEFF